jgi:DNA-binding XRE family transcriptional regulator
MPEPAVIVFDEVHSFDPQIAATIYHAMGTFPRRGIRRRGPRRAESLSMEAARQLDKKALVGTNIRRARHLRGMTQARLAQELGISQPRLSDYEAGRHEPEWDRLAEIARLTRIDGPGWFYVDHPELDPDDAA